MLLLWEHDNYKRLAENTQLINLSDKFLEAHIAHARLINCVLDHHLLNISFNRIRKYE